MLQACCNKQLPHLVVGITLPASSGRAEDLIVNDKSQARIVYPYSLVLETSTDNQGLACPHFQTPSLDCHCVRDFAMVAWENTLCQALLGLLKACLVPALSSQCLPDGSRLVDSTSDGLRDTNPNTSHWKNHCSSDAYSRAQAETEHRGEDSAVGSCSVV